MKREFESKEAKRLAKEIEEIDTSLAKIDVKRDPLLDKRSKLVDMLRKARINDNIGLCFVYRGNSCGGVKFDSYYKILRIDDDGIFPVALVVEIREDDNVVVQTEIVYGLHMENGLLDRWYKVVPKVEFEKVLGTALRKMGVVKGG